MLNEINLSQADLNLLVLFEVVLTHKHVGRAAKHLNLTSSAVSHGLGRLRRLFNDPLFLRTPKGVVPTARAIELTEPIADILARVRSVVASAEPFEPEKSRRRFVVGAPDGLSAVLLPALLPILRSVAPLIDIGVRELLPPAAVRLAGQVWEAAFAGLDARAMDIAVLPLGDVPSRFVVRPLYEEDFVIATRARHPFAAKPTLERFCVVPQLVVSLTGDAFGFVDEVLARRGLSRRIALTVPNFMMALAMIAETDLIAALPRRLMSLHARHLGVRSVEPPLTLPSFQISLVAPKAAVMDAGVAWLLDQLQGTTQGKTSTGNAARAQ